MPLVPLVELVLGTSTAASEADSNGRHQEDEEEGEKKHLLPEAMVIAQMPMIE